MNAPVHLGSPPVGSADWHDLRRPRVNGSEIAAVLGISPYDSPFSLWHRKAGRLGEVEQTPEMFWGNALESVILGEFARRHREWAVTDGGGLWSHPDRSWQSGSPDGLIFQPADLRGISPVVIPDPWSDDEEVDRPAAMIEVKTARYDYEWGDEGTDAVPVQYRAQILWYLDVFGLTECHVPVLIAGAEYREYRVRFDEDEVAQMRAAARAFLDTLEADQPPPIDAHDATYQAVRELHPDIEPTTVEIAGDTARAYLRALALFRDAADEKCRTASELVIAMGSAQHATWLGDRIASRIPPRTDGAPPYLRAANGAADLLRGAST